ncbi:hypothetical protein JFU47_06410 [Pseudomonas sp. TH39(2020)]|uniref:DUF5677 domain-containing protein n=1 Tax=Pseudomonas sp. TH39(2020) TaxID=2796349 RepID=UPI001913BD9B|nr:DUF5677 domain-containing protein [Pseudomonas sp. TH39(2020)]MBK5396352.1 hypothetical protein [Pseudomonas sp. TH39(2020)]
MNNDTPIKDYTSSGNEDDLRQALETLQDKIILIMDWVDSNCIRTNESAALLNLLSSTSQCVNVFHTSIGNHISILALAVRNLYEINLISRTVLQSEENLNKWISEAITDNIQVLEGILGIHTTSDLLGPKRILQTEIDRLEEVRAKHGLQLTKQPITAAKMAESLGLGEEHKNYYKLFSKLVHPSSYLVNNYANAASSQTIVILQMLGQKYAFDTVSRISKHLNIPEHLNN